jgi:hypothetical protein
MNRRGRASDRAGRLCRWPAVLARLAAVFIVLQAGALAAVAAGDLVPDGAIVEELHSAVASGAVTETTVFLQRTGGISDHYGECVMLGMGLGEPAGRSWFSNVALSPTLHSCPHLINRLESHAAGAHLTSVEKIRYWNGLTVVARPALATVGVNGLRAVAAVSLLAGCALLAAAVGRAAGRLPAVALLAPLVAAGDPVGLLDVFHHPLMLGIGLAGAAVLARRAARDRAGRELAFDAFVVGSVYSFFDLMSFVPGLWAVSAAVVAACVPARHGARTRAERTAAVAVAWPAGYVSMWVCKWIWAAAASSPSAVVDEIAGQVRLRIDGETEYSSGDLFAGLGENVGYWLGLPLVPTVLVASGLALVVAVRRLARRGPGALLSAAVIAGPALIVVLFMLATSSHNEVHEWFEYRSLPMALGVLLMASCTAAGVAPPAAAPPPPAEARRR